MADIALKCRKTGESFTINDWEQDFLRKMDLPLPTVSPSYSLRRRLSHRNERKIYKNKCALSGQSTISVYSPNKNLKVYSQDVWWSDKWDPRDYGRDYDFSRPFFEQFNDLTCSVPKLSLLNTKGENSEYCNLTTSNKNCYLVFGGDFNEDCLNSLFCMHCTDCSDVYLTDRCELCYDLLDCQDCYNCKYSQNCGNCKDGSFLNECRGCSNCFGCVGLVNKQYYIFNKAYSKDTYIEKVEGFNLHSHRNVEMMKKTFEEFKLKSPHRYAHIINCENCSGDNIINAKNCKNCFDVVGPAEDCKDLYLAGWGIEDILRCDHVGHGGKLFYETFASVTGQNCIGSISSWDSSDIYYSEMIVNGSANLFGCCQMKKASYCILNKQYKKEEYFDLRDRIIAHMKETREWGEFFPMKNSPYTYNESVANDLFPKTKEETIAEGLKWFDEEKREIGSGATLPDSINDADSSVTEKTYVCEQTGRPYKINEKELSLCEKMGVPLPHYAPETRNNIRLASRKPRFSWDRKCDKCGMKVVSSYPPDRPEIIYCEKCYLDSLQD